MIFCKCIFIFSVCFITIMNAAKLDESHLAKILQYEFKNEPSGSYYYQYKTSDGQLKEESGHVNNPESEHSEIVVKGSYSYVGPDGKTYTVHYTADKDGFHPTGDHIKVPPYTPWPTNVHIQEDDGQYHSDNKHINDIYLPSTSTLAPPTNELDNLKPLIIQHDYINSHTDRVDQPTQYNDAINPFANYNSKLLSNAYIPSSPSPKISAVTVSPLNHIAEGSSPLPDVKKASFLGEQDVINALFEVIQNNHSSGGVFTEDNH